MTYKRLKREALDKLLKTKDYPLLVASMQKALLSVFKDVRNLIFDRELGTSLLSHLAVHHA